MAERLRREAPARSSLRPEPKIVQHLANCCRERSDLLEGREAHKFSVALVALSAHWRDWVRPPDGWEPPEGDTGAQFGSLARHLLAVYEVPPFMDAAWRAGPTTEGVWQQGWYKHIASGRNIRTAVDLPIPLTRRMAHAFLQAPGDLDIPSAFRWAQVRGLGGDDRLARNVLASRIGTDFGNDDFSLAVVRWLVAHPDLPPLHHGPVIDYLHHQKFLPSVANRNGRVRGQPRQPLLVPPEPNLCVTGRTPESLLRAVERWHKRLGEERRGTTVEWKPSGIRPFTLEAGRGADRKVYALTELIGSEELEEEGRAMLHCVATYWALCASGQTSIWSLTVEDGSGQVTRLATLEVRNGSRTIVQARRRDNQAPGEEVLSVLELWADAGGPSLCRWMIGLPPMEV